MHGRSGNTERGLRCHAGSLGPLDAGDNVSGIIQSAENTGDIHSLSMLHLILQLTYIIGHRIHTQGIESAVQHVRLDAYLIERLAESAHGRIRILSCQQVHLFKGTAICLHTIKASHIDNGWGNTFQLILAGLELS